MVCYEALFYSEGILKYLLVYSKYPSKPRNEMPKNKGIMGLCGMT
jgi:hypothetical protein